MSMCDVGGFGLRGVAEQLGQSGDAFDQVVVAQGVGHPEVARGAEGLTRHHRHLGLVDGDLGQLGAGRRPRPRGWTGRSRPSTEGKA